MLKELRAEVRAELDKLEAKRSPVLRRSELPDALLACDVPTVCTPEVTEAFARALEAKGWTVRRAVIWLMLDKPVPMPAPDMSVKGEGEVACCISLLERHPSLVPDAKAVRAICKAAEQNPMALRRVCAALHAEWAEKLRLDETLPGGVLPYLQTAVKEVEQK